MILVLDCKIKEARRLYDKVKEIAVDPVKYKLKAVTSLSPDQYSILYLYALMERANDETMKKLANVFPAEVYVFLESKKRLNLLDFYISPCR